MNNEKLAAERDCLRRKWNSVRDERLQLKKNIIEKENNAEECRNLFRKNVQYKKLKKEQKCLSKMIKHIEKKIMRECRSESK